MDLLKAQKPYRGGNEFLRSIHDLDVLDKHSALIPIADKNTTVNFDASTGMPDKNKLSDVKYFLPGGTPYSKLEVVDACEKMVQLCENIIEAFALI